MIAVIAVAAVAAAATPEAPRDEGEAEAAEAVAMALWRRRRRRRRRRDCRNGKTVPLMLHPSHCLVHRSPNLPTAKERERKNYKGQAAEQAMVISSTWTRDEAQWFQMAKTRQKRFTYSDFTNYSNPVSATSLDFRFRSLQVLYFQNVSKCRSHRYNQSISRVS